jgi:hypothetical protein
LRCIACSLTFLSALKHYFASVESDDDRGINDARGYACEYVAWRFVAFLTEREAVDFLLTELPESRRSEVSDSDVEENHTNNVSGRAGEAQHNTVHTPLLHSSHASYSSSYFGNSRRTGDLQSFDRDDFTSRYANLNALEIAVVAQAKKFLRQKPVQKIINGIWRVSELILPVYRRTSKPMSLAVC